MTWEKWAIMTKMQSMNFSNNQLEKEEDMESLVSVVFFLSLTQCICRSQELLQDAGSPPLWNALRDKLRAVSWVVPKSSQIDS